MQTYGVPPDVQQFVVGRGPGGGHASHHMFSISSQEIHHSQQQQQQHAVAAVAAAAAAHHHLQSSSASHQRIQQSHHLHTQQQQQQQQQVVQQLGLSPDSAEAPSPIATRPSPSGSAAYRQTLTTIGDDETTGEERGIGGNRWPRQETLALIRIRTEMDANFRDSGLKAPLWEEVSRRLGELGFQRSAKKCKEKFENVHKYYKKTKGGGPATVGAGAANLLQGEDHSNGPFLLSSGSGMAPTTTNGANSSGQRFSENSDGAANLLSDTDDEEYDDPDRNDKRKRKRKSWASQMLFLENLIRKFMDKQDSMHRKFLEAIDRREQDRLLKDDAWRKELGRIQREQELRRSQERSVAATRDAALVAFLQKVTGQTLQLPQAITPVGKQQSDLQDEDFKEHFDPNSKRWPKQEVHALIRLRSGMESKFQEPGAKGPLWEEISTSMGHMGYSRSSKRCKEKWENINKYFRKTKDSSKRRSENSKTCPYFQQLDMLYRTGVLTPPNSRCLTDQTAAVNELQEHLSGHREDSSGQPPEMLAIMPQGAESGPASDTPVTQFYASAENSQQQQQQQQNNEKPNSGDASRHMSLSLIGIHHAGGAESFSGTNNSNDKPITVGVGARAGNLVEEILDAQQQQHQHQQEQLSSETTRETWQQQLQQRAADKSGSNCSRTPPPPSSKDAALIALVHKLTGQASPVDMPLGAAAAAAAVAGAGSNSG
ncbi:trihelix transcription factor GT-2 isoform X2 [Selaginella moellendorffii]|uniref:trihelix transcription factor GT-2 isoform X2 n=1 Tax=Selaginella moellendorffii TaxID=88036 RepID=UPI000D1CE2FC|nr:trihelix transcription factor GT-2 isoform X2 [Selaginella moellendorffii]|eukprot:XP_024532616.1 trihelix transcription factor GT-2 isoform X2 [Selaginella moellendorffii]